MAAVKEVETSDADAVILATGPLSAAELQVLYGPDADKMAGKESASTSIPRFQNSLHPTRAGPRGSLPTPIRVCSLSISDTRCPSGP